MGKNAEVAAFVGTRARILGMRLPNSPTLLSSNGLGVNNRFFAALQAREDFQQLLGATITTSMPAVAVSRPVADEGQANRAGTSPTARPDPKAEVRPRDPRLVNASAKRALARIYMDRFGHKEAVQAVAEARSILESIPADDPSHAEAAREITKLDVLLIREQLRGRPLGPAEPISLERLSRFVDEGEFVLAAEPENVTLTGELAEVLLGEQWQAQAAWTPTRPLEAKSTAADATATLQDDDSVLVDAGPSWTKDDVLQLRIEPRGKALRIETQSPSAAVADAPRFAEYRTVALRESASADGFCGRYVRIDLPTGTPRVFDEGGNFPLSLAEVQVFRGDTNLARTSAARQSSTAHGGVAQRAIDGNTDGTWDRGSTTHTAGSDFFPWWEVDFQGEQDFDRIVIWNRTDTNPLDFGQRLSYFRVTILDANREVMFEQLIAPPPRPSVEIRRSVSIEREKPADKTQPEAWTARLALDPSATAPTRIRLLTTPSLLSFREQDRRDEIREISNPSIRLASAYAVQQRFTRSAKHFADAIQQAPSLLNRSDVVIQAAKIPEVLAVLEENTADCVQTALDVYRVRMLVNNGKWNEVVEPVTPLMAETPKEAELWYWRSRAYVHLRELENAEADAKQIVAMQPLNSSYLHHLGEVYFSWKRWEPAAAAYSEAARLVPSKWTFYQRGRCYAQLRRYDEAIADQDRAAQGGDDPWRTEFLEKRADVWILRGDWRKGATELQSLLRDKPPQANRWEAHMFSRTALAQLAAGDIGAARDTAAEASQQPIAGAINSRWLASAFVAIPGSITRENRDQLLLHAQRAEEPWRFLLETAIRFRSGEIEAAAKALDKREDGPEFQFLAALAHHRLGHTDRARKLLQDGNARMQSVREKESIGAPEVPADIPWPEWALKLILQREAESAIQGVGRND